MIYAETGCEIQDDISLGDYDGEDGESEAIDGRLRGLRENIYPRM